MRRTGFRLAVVVLIASAITAARGDEAYIQATAITETGLHLAKGTYRIITKGKLKRVRAPSTSGGSNEPVAMYMLLSYVAAPTPLLLNLPTVRTGNWGAKGSGPLVEGQGGDWDVSERTTLETAETVAVPGGTFAEVLKYKSIITGAKGDSDEAAAFVNGTRYLWFAKGVGLVRMRYEHSNGKITEAVLLSHSLVGRSDDYLPLDVGNRWTYAWKNGYRREAVIETWKISDQPENPAGPPARREVDEASEIEVVDPNRVMLDLSKDTWIKIAADSEKEFHFPYYLFVPKDIDPADDRHLLVETNNTGRVSDDFHVHDTAAARLLRDSYANRIARELRTPLLVPVFRPSGGPVVSLHALAR